MISITGKQYLSFSLIALICCLLSACGPQEMEDVSSNPEYDFLVGKKFQTIEEVWATGITLDRNYEPQVDYVVLVPGVGFNGPEVVFKRAFNAGHTVEIIRVLKPKNSIRSSVRLEYVVKELSSSEYSYTSLRTRTSEPLDNGNAGLDPSVYKLLN